MEIPKTKEEIDDFWGEDPSDWTKLVPELQMYYEESTGKMGWPTLRHPLVYQVPFFSWKMANKSLEAKGDLLSKYFKEEKWGSALALIERPYRLSMLMEFWRKKAISLEELRDLLSSYWVDAEMPVQYGYRSLVRLFRQAGFLTDVPGLREPVECDIYRGCAPKHKGGISWTLDEERAQWFARRFNRKNGRVYVGTVPPEGVLGVFNNRGEMEVVVDPKLVRHTKNYPVP